MLILSFLSFSLSYHWIFVLVFWFRSQLWDMLLYVFGVLHASFTLKTTIFMVATLAAACSGKFSSRVVFGLFGVFEFEFDGRYASMNSAHDFHVFCPFSLVGGSYALYGGSASSAINLCIVRSPSTCFSFAPRCGVWLKSSIVAFFAQIPKLFFDNALVYFSSCQIYLLEYVCEQNWNMFLGIMPSCTV